MNSSTSSKCGRRRRLRAALATTCAALALSGTIIPDAPVSAATGCWTSTTKYNAKALAGNTIGTVRTIGKWCASGSTVTSSAYLDGWAETSTPGWSAQSHLGRDSKVVSNQGRTWERGKLFFGTTWLQVQEVVMCPRVKGTSTPSNLSDNYCSVW